MNEEQGFAVWLTGLPASGKSSITRELVNELRVLKVPVLVLESDVMRKILTPDPTYTREERDHFYRTLVLIGDLLTRQGVNVIFDATANKREYRDRARQLIERFMEVYVECPLKVCEERDPKGIYARAALKKTSAVPGVQTAYEPPLTPEVTVDCRIPSKTAAETVLAKLRELRCV